MRNSSINYFILYIPVVIASLLSNIPHTSYLIAWLGSFFIYYVTLTGKIKSLPNDLPIEQQLLRPIFLMHIIYSGYMACSSIFFYLDTLGYQYFTFVGSNHFIDPQLLDRIAQCQRYYCLGHAALVHGLLIAMDYPVKTKYKLQIGSLAKFLIQISCISLLMSLIFSKLGSLSQFSIQLHGLSFVSGALALAFSIRERKPVFIFIGIALFTFNFLNALTSGFKEPIIISVLLLGIFLIPVLGKKAYLLFGTALIALFIVLPTFIGAFRSVAFSGEATAVEARDVGFDKIFNNEDLKEDLKNDNWAFLTGRLSEISMFIQYVESTPNTVPFYNFQLVVQSFEALIPRFLWPSKPVTETAVMERAYNAGVANRGSIVSAKPAYIVDSYLSGGVIGIWIALFLFGFSAQYIANQAEKLFGGYFLGTAVLFTGLFQIYWRGNSYEFVANSVFWSYITMLIIFNILKKMQVITRLDA